MIFNCLDENTSFQFIIRKVNADKQIFSNVHSNKLFSYPTMTQTKREK